MRQILRLRYLLPIVFLCLVAAWLSVRPLVSNGAGMVAHEFCSCRFVSGREPTACQADIPPALAFNSVHELEISGRDAVRAGVPLLARRIASHRPGFGCALVD